MSKTRSCRRTPGEIEAHEKAVKIRKMTDEQIVDYMNRIDSQAHNNGYQIGFEEGKKEAADVNYEIVAFIEAVAEYPGIGHATVGKMKQVARLRGINVS